MSINPGGIKNLEKSPIPVANRFLSPILSRFNTQTPSMDARLVAARFPGIAMYGSPYAGTSFPGYIPFGPTAAAVAAAADTSPFYPGVSPGETSDAWRAGLSQAAAAAAYYDPNLAAHYAYSYGSMGLSDGARRKNATRETTSTLKAWLNDHRKNPYPTKGEKIMLAIITKMTLTQVSTWFANARRRLKKENKMTWSPRNRCGEDDDEEDDDDDIPDGGHYSNETSNSRTSSPILSSGLIPNDVLSRGGGRASCEASSHPESKEDQQTRLLENSERRSGEPHDDKLILRQNSLEDSKSRMLPTHLSKHPYPFLNPSSSPSFGGLPVNLTPAIQTSVGRSGIPFPPPVSHFSGTSPLSGMPYTGVSGQFTSTAAASFLAASRGHPLPSHLMAALSEQAQLHQYQQALQNLPASSFLSSPSEMSSKSMLSDNDQSHSPRSSSSRVSPDGFQNTSKASIHSAQFGAPSHSKEKIWSIADVATSGENTKIATKRKLPETSLPSYNLCSASKPSIDDLILRQKLSALSGQNGLSKAITPQQIHHLATSYQGNTPSDQSSPKFTEVENSMLDSEKISNLNESQKWNDTGSKELNEQSSPLSSSPPAIKRSPDSYGSKKFNSSSPPHHIPSHHSPSHHSPHHHLPPHHRDENQVEGESSQNA